MTHHKMDNLLASNERTLVIFDSVCAGLAECLALVHMDIKQMTEHRNQLAEIEQEKIRAKLLPAQELAASNARYDLRGQPVTRATDNPYAGPPAQCNGKDASAKSVANNNNNNKKAFSETSLDEDAYQLKLLDKRLADSFSQAISMCEKQNSLITTKTSSTSSHNGRPNIFQMLLGKGSSKGSTSANALARRTNTADKDSTGDNDRGERIVDNRVIIDDINRQTRLAMQYSKQLEAHLYKVEELRSKYEMHLKMGLVVRSVSRAYLGNGGASMTYRQHSPTNSMNRRHHCSSLFINDSSSLGTHSSMSSLNLSSWSFSRKKASKDHDSFGADSGRQRLDNSQRFISTISLNNHKNSKQRLSLAKLISSTTNDPQQLEGPNNYVTQSCAKYLHGSSNNHGSPVSATTDTLPSSGSPGNSIYPYEGWHIGADNNGCGRSRQDFLPDNDSLKHNSIDRSTGSHPSLKRNLLKGSKQQQVAAVLQQQQPHQVPSKTTIREFIDNIDKIESELESYMGSFLLAVEDIQGFARVCQGDVFEIIIKYGEAQKFKTRISVLKDNRQKCDNRRTVFKARIADILAIKAYECKGLGKKVLLGHKLFETRDLFTARSQLMTISLNQTGTIKLNMIVTWNPLHMAPNTSMTLPSLDISHISLPPTPISSSTLSSVSSVPSINGATTIINIQAHHHSKASNSPLGLDKQHKARHLCSNHRTDQAIHQSREPPREFHIPPPDYITNDVDY